MAVKALVWLRVSSNKQDEASQLPDIRAYCDAQGYEVTETVEVHGESAYHGEQDPYWAKAVDSACEVIVCWKVDRLDRRNLMVAVPMVNRAIAAGKRVEFATQQFIDLTTMQGRIAFAMFCEMAHEESKIKSDRSKAKQASLRAAGSYAHGIVPAGYDIAVVDGVKTLVPNEDAALILRAFELAAEGLSVVKIAKQVNLGMTPNGILAILRRPVYRGHIQHHGVTYASAPAIVPAALWLAANQALSAKAQSRGHGSRGRPQGALLRPTCECGLAMYRYRLQYRCLTAGGCRNSIDVAVLDAQVYAEFATHDEPEILEAVVPGRDWAEEIAATQLAIRDLDFNAEDYDQRHATLIAELRRLRTLPAQPTRRSATYTGRTEGDAFQAMTEAEQKAFIRLWTLTVYAKDSGHPNALALALTGKRWMLHRAI